MGYSQESISPLEWLAETGYSIVVSSAVQATLLLAVVCAIAWSIRGASSAVRHLLWLCALGGLAVLPVVTGLLPGWDVLPGWMLMPTAPDWSLAATSEDAAPARDDMLVATPAIDRGEADRGITGTSTDGTVGVSPTAYEQAATRNHVPWGPMILIVWMTGCAAALLPALAGMASLLRLEWKSTRIGADWLESAARRVGERLRVKRPVRVLVTGERSMPMLWGILRPTVMVPAFAREWSVERVEAVLMHEIAHVRRQDCLTQLAARFVGALYWYHPLVWWVIGQLRLEGERACDDLVLEEGHRAPDYAEHLLHVAAGGRMESPLGSAAIGMAGESRLEIRVRAILDGERNRLRPTLASATGCVMLVGGMVFPLALLRSVPSPDRPAVEAATGNPFEEDRSVDQAMRVPIGPEPLPIRLGHVDDTAEGVRSYAGGGHAVRFRRAEGARYLMAIEIFAHRYGDPTPPAEDFHVYILDAERKLVQACPYPYSKIEWGFPRWYTLKLPAVEVSEEYYVALAFNPHQTKGVFLGYDENVKQSHSYIGRPTTGLEPVAERFDWMVRSVLVGEIPKENPFGAN